MPKYMHSLLNYFPGHAAEDEQKVLSRIFVEGPTFSAVKDMIPGQPRLVIGAKGSGKSAMAFRILSETEGRFPRILLKPQLLPVPDGLESENLMGIDAHARRARISIVNAIAMRVGAAASDEEEWGAILRDFAVDSGHRDESFMRRVSRILASGLSYDIPWTAVVSDFRAYERLIRSLRLYLEQTNSKLYVVIDETDDYSNDGTGDLSGLWGLLTAIRQLAQECVQFRFIVTLRSQVWSRLKRDTSGRFNQVGQFHPYCVYLRTDRISVGNILDRRVELARHDLRLSRMEARNRPRHALWPFFDPESVRVNWTNVEDIVAWRTLLITQARCPRDTVMLVNSLAKHCQNKSFDVIGQDQLNFCIVSHSAEVINEMVREYALDFPALRLLIHSLKDLSFHLTAAGLHDHLKGFIGQKHKAPLELRGLVVEGTYESVIALWSLLFELGVVIARRHDKSQPDHYTHFFFDDDPDLVSIYRWADMESCGWEVNAVIRPALMSLRSSHRA